MNRFLNWKGHAWIGLGLRLYLGAVFLLACFHKVLHPEAFAVDVATYQLLPLWSINLFALVLPWVEALAALMLITGYRARAGALLVGAMMVSFLVALSWALHLDLNMSCGCFASQGVSEDPISWKTVVRDSTWLLMALYVLLLDRNPFGLDRLLTARRSSHA